MQLFKIVGHKITKSRGCVATPHGSDKNATVHNFKTNLPKRMLQLPTGQIKMQLNNFQGRKARFFCKKVATPHGSDKNATRFCKQQPQEESHAVATPHGSDKNATLKNFAIIYVTA